MKKKNKIIAITLSIVLGATALISTVPMILGASNRIRGTAAAKILLARENMSGADESFDWKNMFAETSKQETEQKAQTASLSFAVSGGMLSPMSLFSASQSVSSGELVHDSPAGKVYKNNGEYIFKEISGASHQGLVVESRLFDVDFRVESAAKNISYLKNELNIVNKWVQDGFSKFYLDVTNNKETLIEYYEDNIGQKDLWVVERQTREDANCVYSLMYTDMQTGKIDNPVFLVYVPDERYEYYYGHDGNATDYLIAERDKGYWNVFMPDESSYRNMIISDDFAFQSSGTYTSNGGDYGTVSTVDLRKNLIGNYAGGISVYVSAFDGISGVYADEQACFVDSYDGGEKTFINVDYEERRKVRIGLDKGGFISSGDEFVYDSGSVRVSEVNFEFFSNPGFADPQYDVSFLLEMDEGLSLKEKLSLFETFLNDKGLTCRYSLADIERNVIKNSEVANSINSFYTWNGYLMNSSENFKKAESVIFTKIDNLFAEYEQVKHAELVNKTLFARVSKRQGFAKAEGLTLDGARYNEGKIQIENVAVTVKRSDLLEVSKGYKLQLGISRIDNNGKPLSQNTVNLNTTDSIVGATYTGNDLALSASGTYEIPTALEEGRYVVVVYAVTEDEQIRVSEMQPIGFVDTVNDTIETSSVRINIEGNGEVLTIEYTSKLYFNVSVTGEISYMELRRKMMAEALKHGYPMDNEEITDSSGNVITGGSVAPGEYKLKFVVSTVDGPVTAYVVCTVSN